MEIKKADTEKGAQISRAERPKPIRFIKRPALFFISFAAVAVAASLMAAYPKWHKQETENWVYTYVTERFPGKNIDNLQRLAQIIYREAGKLRLDQASDGHKYNRAALLMGVIQTESEFNRKARSRVGARGFMQLMPATAALLKGRRLSQGEIVDAETNITLGVRYLNDMIREMGSVEKALLAYNAGPGAVRTWGGVPAYYEHVVQAHNAFLQFRHETRNERMIVGDFKDTLVAQIAE
ncbi:MAG: transglycosylase SLT domain-containing protein [Spirochaetes bacterium]|nr:transglycosylase SLT domain-containing protein [Spirochaetota bacterium]